MSLNVNANKRYLLCPSMELAHKPHLTQDIFFSFYSIQIPTSGGPRWYNYFLCGVRGVQDHLGNNIPTPGMFVAVSGNIPPASGLSSSSALVSAAVLASAHIQGLPLSAQLLATIAAQCELYIGTQGGGMDQAIAFLAKQGCAQFIQFHPKLSAQPVKLPNNAIFVVANSLAEMNKAATSDFNERVVECRISCRWLAKRMHLNNWRDIIRFAALQTTLECTLEDLEEIAIRELSKAFYTREDILKEFGMNDEEFSKTILTANTQHIQRFKLRQRTLHVLQGMCTYPFWINHSMWGQNRRVLFISSICVLYSA